MLRFLITIKTYDCILNSDRNCSFSDKFSQIDSTTNIGQCESTDTAVSQNGLFFLLYILFI